MDWQNTFYMLGSITFLIVIFMLIVSVIVGFMAVRAAKNMRKKAVGEASSMAFEMGGILTGRVISKISNLFRRRDDFSYTLE